MRSITKVNYVNEAYDQINEKIEDGTWAEGQRLPSENVLAKELGVSRVVVREALQRMRAEHKIITRQGLGSFCANPNNFMQFLGKENHHVSTEEFQYFREFRRTIDNAAICLAARNRTEEDLAILAEDLQRMEKVEGTNVEEYTQADILFHYHVACATHNPYYAKIYMTVSDMLYRSLHMMNCFADAYSYSQGFHKKLYRCIAEQCEKDVDKILDEHDSYNAVRISICEETK